MHTYSTLGLASLMVIAGVLSACVEEPPTSPQDADGTEQTTVKVEEEEQQPDQTTPEQETQLQALFATDEHTGLRGEAILETSEHELSELSFAVRWLIPDGPFPSVPTTTEIDVRSSSTGAFTVLTSKYPPEESLVADPETNGRDGLAIGYIIAFLDKNNNGALDCRNPRQCEDVFVGASPNTLVLYGEPDRLTDFSPLFAYTSAGITPQTGWSLVHLVPNACEARPTARDWTEEDRIQVYVIGDLADKERCEVRAIMPDVN